MHSLTHATYPQDPDALHYGQRHRAGQRESTALVESTVNSLVNQRMNKRRQMRWSAAGAPASSSAAPSSSSPVLSEPQRAMNEVQIGAR